MSDGLVNPQLQAGLAIGAAVAASLHPTVPHSPAPAPAPTASVAHANGSSASGAAAPAPAPATPIAAGSGSAPAPLVRSNLPTYLPRLVDPPSTDSAAPIPLPEPNGVDLSRMVVGIHPPLLLAHAIPLPPVSGTSLLHPHPIADSEPVESLPAGIDMSSYRPDQPLTAEERNALIQLYGNVHTSRMYV